MQYSIYFKSLIKAQGVPNLDPDQFTRLINILTLELSLKDLKELGINSHGKFSLASKKEYQLKRLTKDRKPEELVREMMELSN